MTSCCRVEDSDCVLYSCAQPEFRVSSVLGDLAALEEEPHGDYYLLLGDFNNHLGDNEETWKGVIGRNACLICTQVMFCCWNSVLSMDWL